MMMAREAKQWMPFLLVWSLTVAASNSFGFQGSGFGRLRQTSSQESQGQLFSTTKRRKNASSKTKTGSILDLEEPAGIVGAKFFGGNKQKEEYFDPVAEAKAGDEIGLISTVYDRFEDRRAFDSPRVAEIGHAVQRMLNSALYVVDEEDKNEGLGVRYAHNLIWESCFDTKSESAINPLVKLEEALKFYKELDIAIVSGKQLGDDRMVLQWQISVVWPIFWEPRVLLTGSSKLTLRDGATIAMQTDVLDSSSDLISTIGNQLWPRFWDTYHIGMTPSAEIMPRVMRNQGLLPKAYKLFEISPRLVSAPTQLDSAAGRAEGNAQIVPNHAFSCVIKTMGPQTQSYVTASPLQVQIMSSGNGQGSSLRLKWSIPLSVNFQTSTKLPLPGNDPEARPNSEPECKYEFQPRRLVATLPYGGTPQDAEISDVRQELYNSVLRDGLKPQLDDNGRPQFLFLENGVKACHTEGGLGMCVYEWRPKVVKSNEVGIELELPE